MVTRDLILRAQNLLETIWAAPKSWLVSPILYFLDQNQEMMINLKFLTRKCQSITGELNRGTEKTLSDSSDAKMCIQFYR